MSEDPRAVERSAVERVASELTADGYEVLVEPGVADLPFDLGGYKPDIVARKGDRGLIIEVKSSERHTALDRYVDVATRVRHQSGWRFLLIPVDRYREATALTKMQLPSWEELYAQEEAAQALFVSRLYQPAFLTLWSGLEGLLRRVGEDRGIPVGWLSHSALIKHLYSFGVLSMDQFRALQGLIEQRNAVVHGFRAENAAGASQWLLQVYRELLERWAPRTTAA